MKNKWVKRTLMGIVMNIISLAPAVLPTIYNEKVYSTETEITENYSKKLEKARIDSIMNLPKLSKKEIYRLVDSKHPKIKPKYCDKNLIKAIISQESLYDQFATSRAGAKGLMQIMNENYLVNQNRNPSDTIELYIPEINIEEGINILKGIEKYLEKNHPEWEELNYKEKLENILASYNGGIGKFERNKFDINKMHRETREYVPIVLGFYDDLTNGKE